MSYDAATYFSRVHIAQIVSVNEAKGTCSVVVIDGMTSQRDNLEIPKTGFSVKGFKSSWSRYMPQEKELVIVGFNPRGECRILGYTTVAGQYSDLFSSSDNTNLPMGDMQALKKGEHDMRSSGGAYLHLSNQGHLLLSAGASTLLRLDKSNNEVRGQAGLWSNESDGSGLRIGDVKRKLPGGYRETWIDSVTPIDPLGYKEYWLHLENNARLSEPIATLLCDLQYGACRNSLGVPQTLTLKPLRKRERIWAAGQPSITPVPVSVFADDVDLLGNRETTHLTATSIDTLAPLAAISTTARSVSSTAETTTSISSLLSTSITAAAPLLTGGGVKLGAVLATEQLMLGTAYIAAMEAVWTQMAILTTALATILPAVQTKLAFVPPDPIAEAFITAASALGTLSASFTTLAASAAVDFLSQKVATE